jgi:hypothetical protein
VANGSCASALVRIWALGSIAPAHVDPLDIGPRLNAKALHLHEVVVVGPDDTSEQGKIENRLAVAIGLPPDLVDSLADPRRAG